jgi:hypothetical protein
MAKLFRQLFRRWAAFVMKALRSLAKPQAGELNPLQNGDEATTTGSDSETWCRDPKDLQPTIGAWSFDLSSESTNASPAAYRFLAGPKFANARTAQLSSML